MAEHRVRVVLDIPMIIEDGPEVDHAPLGRVQLGGDQNGEPTTFYHPPAEQARIVCDMAFQMGLQLTSEQAGIRVKVMSHHSQSQLPEDDGTFARLTLAPYAFPDAPDMSASGGVG